MKANKVVLFYNSYSGGGTFATNLDRIFERYQSKGMQVFPYRIDKDPDKMAEYLMSLNKDSICQVAIAGGDGSINLCVNALIKADYHAPLAIFPAGTANDMATNLNIPKAVEAALDVALDDYVVPFDVGEINGRYYINVASFGFLVDVSQKTDQKVKNGFGMLGYYLKTIEELHKVKPFKIRMRHDGLDYEESIYFMVIMNSTTAGGFKNAAPKASVSDGKFDIVGFRECPILEFPIVAAKFVKREHLKSPYIIFKQIDEIIIDSELEVGTDIDGEKGPEFPLHIKVLPSRFNVHVHRAIR
ncbi:MAG: YegS/Rv2252/BmrU family lipid kinase [Firmicutes bacterium]|nr:YegS/Rv2252/BmrU family lipid kinase [Bacillota bacterium]